jgi:NADPH-dependent 2,4-dienoyl-CoA reductase/sulfur reductase-like enzyme
MHGKGGGDVALFVLPVAAMKARRTNRRRFLQKASATAVAAAFARPMLAWGAGARVVVIGGGFGGASCARALKRLDQSLQVTLVEANPVYTALPLSNAVIAGLRGLNEQQFRYDGLRSAGIHIVLARATNIDTQARTVVVSDGAKLGYDKLVVSPGIDFRWGTIAGYDEAASQTIPHAWKGAEQLDLLRRQLEAMEDGGVVAISVPVNPARCPPAPYERASLIAHYLKTKKPRSKVIVIDAKESFTMQKLFESAWKALYPGLIEWISVSVGGSLSSIDVASRTLSTDFDKYRAAVANIIPPQKAGALGGLAGAVDRTGWCPVDPTTFASKLQNDVHVVGDAALAGAMPRSASAAHSQAEICAAAIVRSLTDAPQASPTLTSSCYSLLAPDYAISQLGRFHVADGQYAEGAGDVVISAMDAPAPVRREEAEKGQAWYRSLTGAVFE